jgi:lipopolysaccharide export system permease protein
MVMIKILDYYIAKAMIIATGLVSLLIAGVLFLLNGVTELKNVGQGEYGVTQAMIYVLMCLPHALYQFSPMLILLGSMMGLNALNMHREWLVIRTIGCSVRRLIYSVLSAALILIIAMSVIGEWVAPHLSYTAEIRKENAQHEGQAVVTATGIWFHINHNFIHARQVIGRQLLEGVTRYQFDRKQRLQATYFAKALLFQHNEWVMYDVLKTTFSPGRTSSQWLPQVKLTLKFNPHLLDVGLAEPSEMTLSKLMQFSRYLKQNGLQSSEYQYEFWRRLLQPLAAVVMVFLALPLVLSTFNTTTLSWRTLIGIAIGLIFYVLNELLGQLCVVYQLPAMAAASLPLVLFTFLGFLSSRQLMKR